MNPRGGTDQTLPDEQDSICHRQELPPQSSVIRPPDRSRGKERGQVRPWRYMMMKEVSTVPRPSLLASVAMGRVVADH